MNINPFDLLKDAQKLQEQMNDFQEKLGVVTATGSAGGGLVEIDMNGKLEVIAVRISPQVANGEDIEMLQDLIVSAFTDGMMKIKTEIGSQVGAMGFPGIL